MSTHIVNIEVVWDVFGRGATPMLDTGPAPRIRTGIALFGEIKDDVSLSTRQEWHAIKLKAESAALQELLAGATVGKPLQPALAYL